jgi:glutamate synthase (NADPH) small chain
LWPEPPLVWTKSTSHEEGGVQEFSMATRRFEGENGKLKRLHAVKVEIEYDEKGNRLFKEVPNSEFSIETELVLVAAGFTGAVKTDVVDQLGVALTGKGNVRVDQNKMTNIEGVFAAGDNVRGQSLVVWAIAEGRDVARGVDQYLTGKVRLPTAHTAKTLSAV